MKTTITCLSAIITICTAININAQTITTFAGSSTSGYAGDGGQATAASLYNPYDITIDGAGNVYIADYDNNRIRKVNSSGIISTVAGNGAAGYSGDGGQATAAELQNPTGVAIDVSGNLYIVDENNARIRKVNTNGVISTFAGTGISGYSGNGGQATAAEMTPDCIALDHSGNVYIGEPGNYRVRKINSSGIISVFAGNGWPGSSGDGGQATAASLYLPAYLAVDAAGNVYINDVTSDVIRKVNTSGIISTVAGQAGSSGYSGDGGQATAAQLYLPSGVTVDAYGDLYISDDLNERVRLVSSNGIISTVCGDGTFGYSGDGGPATAAEIDGPRGLFVSGGFLYFCDSQNGRVRSFQVVAGINELLAGIPSVEVYPSPGSGNFTFKSSGITGPVSIDVYDILGNKVYSDNLPLVPEEFSVDITSQSSGIYFYKIYSSNTGTFKSGKLIKL